MEKRLKQLFDYQHFERSERLERLISETEDRAAQVLSDDDLAFVSAAGEAEAADKNDDSPWYGPREDAPFGKGGRPHKDERKQF